MTEPTDTDTSSDEGKEERRRAIEGVLVAFRPEVQEEFHDLIEREVPPPEALRDLADNPDIRRLLKHRLLIDALRRTRRELRDELAGPARNVLGSTMRGDSEATRDSRIDAAKDVLDDVVAAPGAARLQAGHWAQWVRRTTDIFDFTTHETTFRACDDERMVHKRRRPDDVLVPSRLIVAQFWSNRPPTAFIRYIDPSNWPACSAFWREMRELSKVSNGVEYDGVFQETVVILGSPLTVRLQVAYRVRPDERRVWTRFNLAPGPLGQSPVDVDTGTVSAESVSGGPAPTLVRATKYLHWRDDTAPDLSKLACDFGWSEGMVQMAELCLEPAVSTESAEPGTTMRPSVDDAVKRLVEEVVTQSRDGIGATGPHLEKLIGRFTGPSWDARWINDLLAMGRVTVDRYGAIASSVRRFADSLKAADDREDGS